jgi:cytochrome c oxidase subunit 2
MIMLHTSNWAFSPSIIRLKKGEDVSLHLMGMEGNHGLAIPGLGISERMDQGGMKMVKVPTDTSGTFEFFCSEQCGVGHSDMQGTIIIE